MRKQTKVALITGITGQDGCYLAEFLLGKGYQVHGIVRRTSTPNTRRIDHLLADTDGQPDGQGLQLHHGDVTETASLTHIINTLQPDEIYNFAAMSQVGVSFQTPEYATNVSAMGPLRILEAVRSLGLANKTRIYQASTSEMFGAVTESPQNENTPFHPCSPYAIAKLCGHWFVVDYRRGYGMFACNGICFNHESPTRGEDFVTRKITRAAARIALGLQDQLHLGNLDAKRDWGHARDYVRAMWMILQADAADDWVIASGRTTTVRDFLKMAFSHLGITLEFRGSGVEEKAFVASSSHADYHVKPGTQVVAVDSRWFRPGEVHSLYGDPSKIREQLGWHNECELEQLVAEMVDHDLQLAAREQQAGQEKKTASQP